MLQRLRGNNSQGFTLIELMIVIAIIGILAAIAIPNFIAYRNKSYCSQAESNANAVAGALSDYFSVAGRTGLPGDETEVGLSFTNAVAIDGSANTTITITVTDGSTRCPTDYQDNYSGDGSSWDGSGVFTLYID